MPRSSYDLQRLAKGPPASQPPFFVVTVTKDGGLQGNKTTPATWTYTVKNRAGTTTLGKNVPLARPRPNGTMTFQPLGGFGMAFYNANRKLTLWDAGETYGTGGC